MIVIELAELLMNWWFPLSTNPSRADRSNIRKLGYTVRGGIEAGGQIKSPRTGVGVCIRIKLKQCDLPRFFSSCKCLEGLSKSGIGPYSVVLALYTNLS